MGQPKQPGQETTDQQMQGYIKNLPDFMKTTLDQMLPNEQGQLDVRRQIDPQQHQLELDMANQFLPQFTKVGLDQQRQQEMGQAANDTEMLKGPGQDLVRANLEAQKIADPEYYAERAATKAQLDKLMGSLDDPNAGLSPTERAEIERSTARTNAQRGLEAPTATSAVESAMNFGSAGAARKSQKQDAINKAVSVASGAMPALKSGVDVLQLTTGRPSVPNVGLGQMAGNRDVGSMTQNMGSQLFGEVGQNSRQTADINSKKRTPWDSAMAITSQVSDMAGAL